MTGVLTSLVEVSMKPMWVYALTLGYPAFRLFTVHWSVQSELTDSWMRPVVKELEEHCYDWVSTDRVEDEDMIGAAAFHDEYHLYQSCPGVPHTSCINKKKEANA